MNIASRLDRIEELLQVIAPVPLLRVVIEPGGDSEAAAALALATARDPRSHVMVIVTGVPDSRAWP